MSAEEKEFIDVSTIPAETALDLYNRDMPDVSMALPWSTDVFPDDTHENGNPSQPNGAVWPWRFFLGAEDDPNKARVYKWEPVDDMAGLTTLWAGVYNGTIYLHAGDEPPEAAEDDGSDITGAPIGDGEGVWRNGQPVLPFSPVPMDTRDQMLRNESGKWRRLVWEPIGLFDVATSKTIFSDSGRNIKRHTLWCIVEGPWVAFYTTAAMIDSPVFADGAPARWPFSYYKKLLWDGTVPDTYTPTTNDGGIFVGWYDENDHTTIGYRLAPLPWQEEEGGELEEEGEAQSYDGVQEGQFYTMPAAYPCGRYLATMRDYRVIGTLQDAYQGYGEHYEYEHIDKEEAKSIIVGQIQKAATHVYSIDPALMEEKLNEFPNGIEEGSLWQTDPPPYEVVFSLHLDEQLNRWPHWLALMACHAPTALLTASACNWYNDFRPAGGWPEGSYDPNNPPPSEDPNDPGDRPPNGDERDWYIPDFPYDPDDPDKDDDYKPSKGTAELVDGYFYEGGDGVNVKNTWNPRENSQGNLNMMPGWDFIVSIDDIAASGTAYYTIELTVDTENDSKTYTYKEKQRNMYYGVKADGSNITVEWKSSWLGDDDKPKTATAAAGVPSSFSARMGFGDTLITSETPPDFCGTYLTATLRGYFSKTGMQKVWDNYNQKWIERRYRRRFAKYRLSRRLNLDKFLRDYVAANPPEREGTATPDEIQGHSDGLDGPKVKAVSVLGNAARSNVKKPIGVFASSIVAEFEPSQASFEVNGSAQWKEDGKTGYNKGSISGTFTAELSATTIDMIL